MGLMSSSERSSRLERNGHGDYHELSPPPDLRDALSCLWVRRMPGDGLPLRVLPDACVDIIWRSGQGAFVAGPDTGPALSSLPPGALLVGARFRPGAGGAALGTPLAELRDQRVDLADVLPDLDRRLAPDLSPREALERVRAMAARLAAAGPPDRAVGAAAARLADPRARVESLAGDLGFSERQLRRRFQAGVGYGPKTLQRVLRFQRFLAHADAGGPGADLARLAADAGYADQAHLTRECARLSGLPPTELLRTRAAR
jgi:AraC-like DNA-binding protein